MLVAWAYWPWSLSLLMRVARSGSLVAARIAISLSSLKTLPMPFMKALDYHKSAVFNIGSDNVPTLAQAYSYVIGKAGTKARVAHLPRRITLSAMKLAYASFEMDFLGE